MQTTTHTGSVQQWKRKAPDVEEPSSMRIEGAEVDPASARAEGLAAAARLRGAASYVPQSGDNQVAADLAWLVKSNPGASLLTAIAIGFFVGYSWRREAEGATRLRAA